MLARILLLHLELVRVVDAEEELHVVVGRDRVTLLLAIHCEEITFSLLCRMGEVFTLYPLFLRVNLIEVCIDNVRGKVVDLLFALHLVEEQL